MRGAHHGAVSPILKWPGGKQWLAPVLAPLLVGYVSRVYIEPFAGSAATFLAMRPRNAVLSDVNHDLVETLITIRDQPDELLERVWRLSNSASCYYRVRSSSPRTTIGRAARFLYLNRTAWGGMYRQNRKGEFNVPFGNSGRVICRKQWMLDTSRALAGASLKHSDFEAVIDRAGPGDVVYADPPYVGPHRSNEEFARYNATPFTWRDQTRLTASLERAVSRGAVAALSGRASHSLANLLPQWSEIPVERICGIPRDPSRRRIYHEVLLSSVPFDSATETASPRQAADTCCLNRRILAIA